MFIVVDISKTMEKCTKASKFSYNVLPYGIPKKSSAIFAGGLTVARMGSNRIDHLL